MKVFGNVAGPKTRNEFLDKRAVQVRLEDEAATIPALGKILEFYAKGTVRVINEEPVFLDRDTLSLPSP